MNYLRQSTAATIKAGPFLSAVDGITAQTALTISQADVRLAKEGGDFAQKADTSAAVHDEAGWYDVALNTTDTGTLGRLQVAVAESGALPVWHEYTVLSQYTYDEFVLGQGTIEYTYTLTNSLTGAPIPGVTIRITSDLAGLNTIWTGTTDVLGIARNLCNDKPRLPAGTVYIWRTGLSAFTFSNPDTEVIG